MLGVGFRVQGAGRRVQGAGCRVQGAGCRVQGVDGEATGTPATATGIEESKATLWTPIVMIKVLVGGLELRIVLSVQMVI